MSDEQTHGIAGPDQQGMYTAIRPKVDHDQFEQAKKLLDILYKMLQKYLPT